MGDETQIAVVEWLQWDSRPNFRVRPYATLSANQTHLNALTNEITALLSQSSMSASYQLDLTWWHVRSKAQTVLK